MTSLENASTKDIGGDKFPKFQNMKFSWATLQIALMLMICIGLTIFTSTNITGANIKGDATQNLKIAYALYEHGNFSLHGGENGQPANFREPLPPFATALYLKAFHSFTTPFNFESLHGGEHTRFVKLSNLFWVFFGLIGSFFLGRILTRSYVFGIASVVLTSFLFFNDSANSLYTELNTATLLIWQSVCILHASKNGHFRSWVLAGSVFAMLCLTKALFLYFLPLICIIPLFSRKPTVDQNAHRLGPTIAMLLGAVLLIAPWMIRNNLYFDSPQITQGRAGWVLYKRALLNDISEDEFKRAFTLWGPQFYKDLVHGTPLGIEPNDYLKADGALRRLYYEHSEFRDSDRAAQGLGRPEDTVSLYHRTSAVYVKLAKMFKEAGRANPHALGDKVMQDVAMERIKADPVAHLKTTPLMFWRAFFFFREPTIFNFHSIASSHYYPIGVSYQVLNILCFASLFWVFFAGLIKRNMQWLALSTPSLAMIAFYSLLSQNLPRFFAPSQPIMIITLLLVVYSFFTKKTPGVQN